jgi:O-antigen/teichoic acid export membrane protein
MVYAIAAVFSRGVTFLIVPIYTRLLNPQNYGALDLILTAGLLINMVVALEVGQGLAREWAEQPGAVHGRSLASTAVTFTLLAHLGFLVLALLMSVVLTQALLGSIEFVSEFRTGLIFIAANAVFLQLQSQFRWDLRARSYAAVSVLYGVLTLCLGAGLGWLYGLQGILWGQALAAGISCVVSVALLRGQIRLALASRDLIRMLRYSLPLVPSGVAVFASFYVNRWILSMSSSLAEVGIFSVGQRVAGLTLLLIVGLQGALTPLIYRHHREPGVPAQLARIFEGFVGVAMLVCLLLSAFSRDLIGWLASADFQASATLLPWLAPAVLLGQMYIFAPGIAIARKTRWQLSLTSLSAAVAVGLNLWLIPLWGALGAAVSSCLTSAVFLVLWMVASQRVYALPFRFRALASATAAYIAMVSLVLLIGRLHWPAEVSVTLKFLATGSLAVILNRLGLFQWRELTRLRSEQEFNNSIMPSASQGTERE